MLRFAPVSVIVAAWSLMPSCLGYEPNELDVRNAGSTLLLNSQTGSNAGSDTGADSGTSASLVGTITGLVATSITLQNNGAGSLVISANGAFDFGQVPTGSAYSITILTQPTDLNCFVQNGSGTFTGTASIVVTCPIAVVGGVRWFRCTHGQQWNATTGDCTGTGTAPGYGAAAVQFCASNDNSCNSGSDTGALASGALFDACNSLNTGPFLGISTWRVASGNELKSTVFCSTGPSAPLADGAACNGGSTTPRVANYFPNTQTALYSSSTSVSSIAKGELDYATGMMNYATFAKSASLLARCVSN